MTMSRVILAICLLIVLGVPLALRPGTAGPGRGRETLTLVIVTPHVPQIRAEFEEAFSRWHERKFGAPVEISWRVPGGTSEIMKVLEAHFRSRASSFDFSNPANPTAPSGSTDFDLMLGGGSFDHGRLKTQVRIAKASAKGLPADFAADAKDVALPMSEPAGFSKAQLDAWFGENKIGAAQLYDPDQFWLGTAVSGFGIVYNRDVLRTLGVAEPKAFSDLTDPRLMGLLALADPRQSGSVTTAMDAILSNYGWEKGWRVLREIGANTRYYTNSSTKPPIDVSAGEAAAGLAIDFYGRGQAQSVLREGQDPGLGRVGYVDPRGATFIDADPVSVLRGGPQPELARRFVEFSLTEEAQALWQFWSRASSRGERNPLGDDGEPMGPRVSELRRMPVRRAMYEKHMAFMIDQVNPFAIASDVKPAGWRSAIGIMMGAFAIDVAHEQREAWTALNAARSQPAFDKPTLAKMEEAFYAFPTTEIDGKEVAFTPETYKAVSATWRDPKARPGLEIRYTEFFRARYREVAELGARGMPN
jgi:ABC-type Fe3+ transport system substrate-binding protein